MIMIGAMGVVGSADDASAAGCPNEALRIAQTGTFLSSCRAFELVSPSDGEPNLRSFENPEHNSIGVRASSLGSGISWFSYYPLSSSLGGEFYNLSTRGPGGWSTEPVGPRLSAGNAGYRYCRPEMFFSADLSASLLTDGKSSIGIEQNAEEGECATNLPHLVAGEPEGFQNVFLRRGSTGTYTLVDVTPEGVTPGDASVRDASEDFSHVVFEDAAKLSPSAPVGANLYEWVNGTVRLVTILPDGTSTTGSLPGPGAVTHTVSTDGTRIIFEAEGKLFLRENAEQELESSRGSKGECLESNKACTLQLDASQAEGLGGSGRLLAANSADTRIFFVDGSEAKLTADTTEGSGQQLYEYDAQTGKLNDLTPAGGLGLFGLSGISSDGSYLYVVAGAVLAAEATAGQPNLYAVHDGAIHFVATLAAEGPQVSYWEGVQESKDWNLAELTTRVSPSGRYIAFTSIQRLTGYDNTPAQTGDCTPIGGSPEVPSPCREIFLYDASRDELHCVSCGVGSAHPTGPASIPLAEKSGEGFGPVYLQRSVLDDGRVFFDTASSLLPQAANGLSNVYEYNDRQLNLISTGESESNSFFYDASPGGDDVFFVTAQHLVGGDTANGMRLYDARVDGGFPEPAIPAPSCSGEGCRGSGATSDTLPPMVTGNILTSGNLRLSQGTARRATRKQKLDRALHACQHKKTTHKRAMCRRKARRRFAVAASIGRRGAEQ